MAKTKKVLEAVETEATEATDSAKSDAYIAKKAFFDAYEKQNPAKYALKKASFDRILATL
jgi:hypothetical protein